jgi:MFS family permease
MNASPAVPVEPMPPGLGNVYVYETFNAVSWIVVLGSPMLLYLQRLHASATVLALAASLGPAMSILQIPAAPFVEKIGYRRFVVNGWTARSVFIIVMTVVAFLPDGVDRTTRIVLMLFLSFGYNFLRGISLCGILPWFTHIVPESRRGEFLAKDQMAAAVAVVAALAGFSWILTGRERWYSFGAVFAISAVSAFISVRFLRRVPDVAVEKIVVNPHPMPWREMFFFPPFQRYIRYNAVINVAIGASTVFWVRFFRQSLHLSDSNVLAVGAITTSALAFALLLVSTIIDRTGSRPALTLSGGLFACHFFLWAGVAAGLVRCTWSLIVFQSVVSGLAGALWNLANVRAVIGLIPVMGRAHFLALYSVVANLTTALVPVLWGPILDALEVWQKPWGWWQWNSFSLFYVVLAVNMLVGLVMLQDVEEPEAMNWNTFTQELLVKTPARAVSRVISRLRTPGL